MFRDRSEELARLEAEPREEDEFEDEDYEEYEDEEYEDEDYEDEDYEDDYTPVTEGYEIYNTDDTDEDLEAFAQEVRAPKRGGFTAFLAVLLCLLTLGLLGLIILVLHQRGLL